MVKTLPEIIAHRGATYLAPENTLSAFRNAIDLGADGVEMDVQQTRDHGLIIHHDYLIDIGTELSAKIYDLTVGELRSIDLTKWNGVSLTTERLATLDEALACCKEMEGCAVQLELKAPILPDPDFVPHIVDCIRASGIADRLLLVSFRHDLLQQAKALMPELRIGVLTLGDLLSMMLPPPVIWQDLGLVNSMDEPLDEENCPALKKQVGMVSSVISDKLTLIAALYPQMSVRQILATLSAQADPAAYVRTLGFPVELVSCEYHTAFANPEVVNQLHDVGCKAAFWTVNTEDVVRSLVPLGPDCFVTDRPDVIREWIEKAQAEM